MKCPGDLVLCGVLCGCDGRNPSHYPRVLRGRITRRDGRRPLVDSPDEIAAMIAAVDL